MKNPIINAVVFDLGGVLIDWNPRHLYRKIFNDEQAMEYFLTNICTMEWNECQDAGRSWEEGIQELVEKYPEQEMNIRAYYERWTEMLNGAFEDTVKILQELKQNNIRVLALTNWSNETFHHAEAQFPFLKEFEGIIVSGKELLKKPDPRIFQLLLERYKLIPQHTAFIDDNLRNVQASNAIGMYGIQFINAERLRHQLCELMIL